MSNRHPLGSHELICAIGSQLRQLTEHGVSYLAADQIRVVANMLRACAHRLDLIALERGPWVEFDGGAA